MANYQELNDFRLPINFRGRSGWYVQLWWIVQSIFFNSSPQFMYGWRRFLMRSFGAKIGKNVILRPSMHTQFPWKVEIGDSTWIGDDVVLYSLGQITIGKDVVISQKSYLCTGSHDYSKIAFPIYSEPITIQNGCWLATDVYIGPGVTIEAGTVVGARSSVFKSLPGNKICMGSPAKIIRDRA